jgi:hypothetical protein
MHRANDGRSVARDRPAEADPGSARPLGGVAKQLRTCAQGLVGRGRRPPRPRDDAPGGGVDERGRELRAAEVEREIGRVSRRGG